MYNTWPCKTEWHFRDDQAPTPDFTGVTEGAYFTVQVGSTLLYGIGSRTPPTANDFYCYLFSDPQRTQEIVTGDYTGQLYTFDMYAGWTWEPLGIDGTADPLANGRWVSNPVILHRNGGVAQGKWVVVDRYDDNDNIVQARHFEGDFVWNPGGVRGLTLTEGGSGSLAAGTYTVHVGAVIGGLEAAASYEQITISANSSIDMVWLPVPGADSYNVYLNCQLKVSGVIGTTLNISDNTVEDPLKKPPEISDPGIPADPNAPVITIDPLGGGKATGTDSATGTEYEVTVEPGVPYNPDEVGTKIIKVTDVAGTLNTETFAADGVTKIAWEKLTCTTDPESGEETCQHCIGNKSGAQISQLPINQVWQGVPYPLTTPYGSDDVFSYPLDTPLEDIAFPTPVQGSIVYVDGSQNIVDPDAIGAVGQIRCEFMNDGGNEYVVGDQEQDGWSETPSFINVTNAATNIEIECITTGDPDDLPGSEWYLSVGVYLEGWEFDCIGQKEGEFIKPEVQVCRQVVSYTNLYPFYAGPLVGAGSPVTPKLGTKITETQCNPNPLFTAWPDLSDLSNMLQDFFGIGSPMPRSSIGAPRPPRGTPKGYSPVYWPYRMWEPGVAEGTPLQTAQQLHLMNRRYPTKLRPIVNLTLGIVDFISLDNI